MKIMKQFYENEEKNIQFIVMFKFFVENSHWGIQNCVLMKIIKPNFKRLTLWSIDEIIKVNIE